MKFLIVFAAIIAATFAQNYTRFNVEGECGKRPLFENNVVGGVESKNGHHPYIISMEYGTGTTKSHSCGGSLINRRWVVTAAHCVSGRLTPANYRIQIGAHTRNNANAWQVSRNVDKIIMHPLYSSSTYKNDIALMRLDTPVEYSDNIQPICVADDKDNNKIDYGKDKGIASGWGSTFSGGSVVQTLREVDLLAVTDAYCSGSTGGGYGTSYDPITMICFGEKGDNKDTCQGDSGGPVVLKMEGKWKLVGITSWGYGCGNVGVYSRPMNYISWIQAQLDANL